MKVKIWKMDSWETPATNYKERQVGNYRLRKSEILEGFYPHYYLDGYPWTQVTKPIPMMLLQEYRDGKWCDWMADDPMDYTSMKKYAEAASGKVLTAGLGLGLVIYELAKNKAVEHITIVERSPEVRDLVYGYIPKEKVTLVMGDYWDFIEKDNDDWDMIITDIWTTKGKEQHYKVYKEEVIPANDYMRSKYPNSKLVFHGFKEVTDVELVQPFFQRMSNKKGVCV